MIQSKYILDILSLILDGVESDLNLCEQIPILKDDNYDYTGVGLFARFTLTEEVKKTGLEQNIILTGVTIRSSLLTSGADATLFIVDGVINSLEVFAFQGSYPQFELPDYELRQEWNGSPGKIIQKNAI